VSKTVEAEYYILNFLIKKSGFKQFNGLIGVLRAKYLYMHKLNEDAITEDADYATRMHAKGYRAVLVDGTKIYEQSPVSWMDLLNQRKRWYYGGLQLWKYWDTVKKSNDRRFILSWVLALTLSYSALIFLPLVIFSPFLMIYYSRRATSKIHPSVSLMLIVHILLLQYSALAAVLKFLRRKSIEWKPMERVIE
jgi:cellulose synthase/poly-beta-1,6-N-acetylglucosamine synthase-like glycosyltransferase